MAKHERTTYHLLWGWMKSTVELADILSSLCNDEVAAFALREIDGRPRTEQKEFLRRCVMAIAMISAREVEQAFLRIEERERGLQH